ncbi:G-type lectin S-receptor-like serine/threonine-protein kinase [Tanacetum coccineum]
MTRRSTWHAKWRTRTRPDPDPAHDPPVDWRSTTVDRWLTGSPAVVNGGSPPLTVVDRRMPPLTAAVDHRSPVVQRWLTGVDQALTDDPRRKGLLDWNYRFVIIDGIAQGLLYLHKFSRLRVIHRDLKASNILLDDYMKPTISDFGMAKLFGINESQANTSRVVGTRGYKSQEYMIEGAVSTKTDVFGFGVLLLEIISSKMNHRSYDSDHPLNLVGLAWKLWKEGRGMELMDPVLEDSCTPKEVMTCIHVGLLCVQDRAIDRPTMYEVISMLTNENMHLPEPKQPAFFIERCDADASKDDNLGNGSVKVDGILFKIHVFEELYVDWTPNQNPSHKDSQDLEIGTIGDDVKGGAVNGGNDGGGPDVNITVGIEDNTIDGYYSIVRYSSFSVDSDSFCPKNNIS